MKGMRGAAAMLALLAVLVAPRADAQVVQLGWNSSMSMLCLNEPCSNILFTLNLAGLQPTDNNGNPVPAAIHNLNSPGYPTFVSIEKITGPGVFVSGTVTSSGTWISFVTGGGIHLQNFQTTLPLSSAPVTINAILSAGGAYSFAYSGLAYLGANQECYDASGNVVGCGSASAQYQQGDFNGTVVPQEVIIPEPMSMTLLATGLVGLGLVSIRRRKQQAK
jgi:hypothetical protein